MNTLKFILFATLLISGVIAFIYYSSYVIGVLAIIGAIQLLLVLTREVYPQSHSTR